MRNLGMAFALLALPVAAPVQAAPEQPKAEAPAMPAVPLDLRIGQLLRVLKGEVSPEQYFAPSFLGVVSPEQFKAVTDGMIAQYGQPQRIISVDKRGAFGATVKVAFEKAIGTVEIDVESPATGKVIGLLVTGFEMAGDTLDAVSSDIKALPGSNGFLIAELGDGGSLREIASHNRDTQFAIGSTFKLYILAELANQVATGTRKWSDVAPLDHRSFSSAGTGKWPKDAPMTLHTLASFMISLSDNSATDSLLFALGREAVERRLASIGHDAPDKTLPFLSTIEAFALKANPALRERFLKASEAQQRDLLQTEAAALTLDKIDIEQLSKGPTAIDTVEWFASPTDLLWLLTHIRAQQNDEMMGIMAINPGISPAAAKKWRYVGYKGGSEPGVISMSFLLQSRSGKWYVATGSWNNSEAEVDNAKFASLMERLVSSVEN